MQAPNVQQSATVLAAIYQQITGLTVPAPLDLSGFVSTATTVLNLGLDKVHNALWQMVGRTIIAIRPYRGRFVDMEFETDAWGIVDRKISYLSRLPQDNQAWKYPVTYDASQAVPSGDGLSVDMYKINKDKIIQTAFYGRSTYAYTRTRFANQLETAFRGPEELTRFLAGAVTSLDNDRELWREGMRSGMLINAIGALYYEDQEDRVVHLLTEYNSETGLQLTGTTVRQPGNFDGFVRWLYAKMGDIKAGMARNNVLYTTQLASYPEGYGVLRHTDPANLRIKMSAPFINRMRAGVLSTTYNPEMLSLDDVEPVAYWQTPTLRETVVVIPVYTAADNGQEDKASEAVTVSNIVGIMYDRDFVGCSRIHAEAASTPYNVVGHYWNDNYTEEYKTRFDMTEKAVLLLLD